MPLGIGRIRPSAAGSIARVADEFCSGELRLTIFQNLIIPNISDDRLDAAKAALTEAALRFETSFVRGDVAACTGNRYCMFSRADTNPLTAPVFDPLSRQPSSKSGAVRLGALAS